jgi:hypothetical protein
MSDYQFGARFFLPVKVHAHLERWNARASRIGAGVVGSHTPLTRPLRVYVIDPADVGLREPTMTLDVPYERLEPGPRGALFMVDDSTPEGYLEALDWSQARRAAFARSRLDLERPELAMASGLTPSTGDPQFAGQMAYAVCQHVHARFCSALGRQLAFGPWMEAAFQQPPESRRVQLLLRPHAFKEDNAYYDPNEGALQFGWFISKHTKSVLSGPGVVQQYVLSHDMICHELAHALLDGMRANFMNATNPDVAAFHEGFADLVALLHHFTAPSLVRQAIEETGGIGVRALLELGRQLGDTDTRLGGGALRSAISALVEEAQDDSPTGSAWTRDDDADSAVGRAKPRLRLTNDGRQPAEPHERGAVLAAAVMEAFVVAFRMRARPLRRLARIVRPSESQALPSELVDALTREVNRLAEHFLRMLIRSIDYCPPIDISFGEFLRAIVTADRDLMPTDAYIYRGALVRAFARRGIPLQHVRDYSEDSIAWAPPQTDFCIDGLAQSRLKLTNDLASAIDEKEQRRWGDCIAAFVLQDEGRLRAFGLVDPGRPYGPVVVESACLTRRLDERRETQRGLVIELSQWRKNTEPGAEPAFLGGSTVIVDESGRVRYIVSKRVNDLRRRKRQAEYQARSRGEEDLRTLHARRRGRSAGES